MPNGRCKLYGGKRTGRRTLEGLERSRRASWKHGHFSREAKAERSRLRAAILATRVPPRWAGRLGCATGLFCYSCVSGLLRERRAENKFLAFSKLRVRTLRNWADLIDVLDG